MTDHQIHIIPYEPAHQPDFERLNRSWIEKYFVMEPIDTEVLTDPQKHILDKGGRIMMAEYNRKVCGAIAIKRENDKIFELTKMGVDEPLQGKGVGMKLCKAALQEAKNSGAEKVILYSQTGLAAAIRLYRKLGFYEIDLEQGRYSRSNIKMQLDLYPMSMPERERLIESYGKAYERIMETIRDFPRGMWGWKPSPARWSIHENLVHLADSEANSYIRCRRLIAEPGSTVLGYDQDKWAAKLSYYKQPAEEALELFRILRKKSYELIRALPEETWNNTIEHSENGTMTFADWLRTYENHTHTGQMRRTYEEWKSSNRHE